MKRLMYLKCPYCGERGMYFSVRHIYTADPIDYPVEPEIICKRCGSFRDYIRCRQDEVKRTKKLLVKQIKQSRKDWNKLRRYYREEMRRRRRA